ncbi:MAG: hypothetical protein ACI4WT_00570 [Oligosphaeraceae bacterium]
MMRRLAFLLALLAGAGCALAQIAVQLESSAPAYLRYEPVRLRVTLTNMSGNTLIFSGDSDYEKGSLYFHVQGASGRHVRSLDLKANPLQNVIMAPNETKVLYVRLNKLFDIQREDTYHITAFVEHSRMGSRYKSKPLMLEIRDGEVLDTQVAGLPTAMQQDRIRSIRFSLIRFRDIEGYLYCLRAEDDAKVYATFRIGPYIMGGMKPQMAVESGNALHLLLQIAPRLYSYTTYSISAKGVRQRQNIYYTAAGGNPRLSRETGYLKVHNVRMAVKGKDYMEPFIKPFGDED